MDQRIDHRSYGEYLHARRADSKLPLPYTLGRVNASFSKNTLKREPVSILKMICSTYQKIPECKEPAELVSDGLPRLGMGLSELASRMLVQHSRSWTSWLPKSTEMCYAQPRGLSNCVKMARSIHWWSLVMNHAGEFGPCSGAGLPLWLEE
jgi:hypothetical protein